MRALVETLKTAFGNNEITLERLQIAVSNGKISQIEFNYITNLGGE